MSIFSFDPLDDSRWCDFVDQHPHATIFHTRGWLNALKETYGHKPVVWTTSAPRSDLRNGVVFCEINSWLTGRRLVSLPFSDHCQPLLGGVEELSIILNHLRGQAGANKWKYIEIRPLLDEQLRSNLADFNKADDYNFHHINLRPSLETMFRSFHDSCVRRKIRKAEREALRYEVGNSESLLQKFHQLLVLTRRRHMLPPQPLEWFRNLKENLGTAIAIRVVSKGAQPVASIITLLHKKCLVYKYGCSDSQFNNLGGTSLLFWKAIQESKEQGAEELDLGRSNIKDEGLSTFKEHLGGIPSKLSYYRNVSRKRPYGNDGLYLRRAFATMPEPIFSGVGRVLYRHMG